MSFIVVGLTVTARRDVPEQTDVIFYLDNGRSDRYRFFTVVHNITVLVKIIYFTFVK
jgi:hypothetical protein